MAGNLEILSIVFLIKDDEEEIETRHDRRGDVGVVSQRLGTVISSSKGVASGKDRGTGIESGVDTSLSDRDSLLLHSFVNSGLILNVHLVELINATDTVIGKHEGTSFDTKLACFNILAD